MTFQNHHLDVLTAVLCLLLALQQDVVNSLRKSWGLYQLLVYKSLYHYLSTGLIEFNVSSGDVGVTSLTFKLALVFRFYTLQLLQSLSCFLHT